VVFLPQFLLPADFWSSAEFYRLAKVLLEIERFVKIDNPQTRRAYKNKNALEDL
jgi:hypothetical protein